MDDSGQKGIKISSHGH
jgi:hypothetical protein